MPSKQVDNYRVPRVKGKDKRIKLTPEQKSEIYNRHHFGGEGIRPLHREFGVSRRLIQFICYPERQAKNLQDRKERGGEKLYYDRDKRREYMKKHRTHKRQLMDEENRLTPDSNG